MDEIVAETLAQIDAERERADKRYGVFASSHEGLGVLVEECDELRDAVRSNNLTEIRLEAIQIAAVAARIAISARASASFRERSVP